MIISSSNAKASDKAFENDVYTRKQNPYEYFTISAIEDDFVSHLSSWCDFQIDTKNQTIHLNHRYLDDAEKLLYRINLLNPIPRFKISCSDIPKKLEETLCNFDYETVNTILTNVVRRILESVDPVYYHTNGIRGKVRWRIID